MVKLVSPRQPRTISGPRNRIESAIAALSGAAGTCSREAWRGEGEAVRDRERGDGLQQCPAVAHDEQQAQDEQQVVGAQQDVRDAEEQVGTCAPAGRRRRTQRDRRLDRFSEMRSRRRRPRVHAHQHVGRVASSPSIATVFPVSPCSHSISGRETQADPARSVPASPGWRQVSGNTAAICIRPPPTDGASRGGRSGRGRFRAGPERRAVARARGAGAAADSAASAASRKRAPPPRRVWGRPIAGAAPGVLGRLDRHLVLLAEPRVEGFAHLPCAWRWPIRARQGAHVIERGDTAGRERLHTDQVLAVTGPIGPTQARLRLEERLGESASRTTAPPRSGKRSRSAGGEPQTVARVVPARSARG